MRDLWLWLSGFSAGVVITLFVLMRASRARWEL